ncbi:hypothetical protein CW702_02930 [Candidatus Bathyarchaeota archaeon]|nr:MAG: hypothetical protein CW702_02930 [Candidatus Bathyarchaeota archaeon]
MYVDDVYTLAEKLKQDPERVRDAIKRLRQDRVVYIWMDKSLSCWKIGLYKSFIDDLEVKHGLNRKPVNKQP